MLPYSVNSPRIYKSKSAKARQSNSLWIFGLVALLLTGVGGLWYLKSKSAHVTGLLAVITEHETKFNQLSAENEKLDTEVKRLNRALEAAKADRASVEGDITYRNNRIEDAETSWRAAAAQLEALTKTHDGVMGQLREAQDRTALAEQEKIEAAMKAAECRQQLNESLKPQTGSEPVLGMSGVKAIADKGAAFSTNVSAGNNSRAVDPKEKAKLSDPLAAIGSVVDEEETHPGLEKPFVKQQEL